MPPGRSSGRLARCDIAQRVRYALVRQAVTTRSSALVAYVEQLIHERGLRPGDRIATKDDLHEQTAAARTTINEAVRLLQNRGRVRLRPGPGGGLFVAEASPLVRFGQTLAAASGAVAAATVSDARVVREALEPLVAADAARHRSAADLAELRALLGELAVSGGSGQRLRHATWRLHERIARVTPNGVLAAMYLGLARFIDEQGAITASGAPAPAAELLLRVYAELVDAIASGDAARAWALAAQHTAEIDEPGVAVS